MISFKVEDMSCGHCVGVITRAVTALDADAIVTTDLPAHRVDIQSSGASAADLLEAIREAGYTPQPVAQPGPAA